MRRNRVRPALVLAAGLAALVLAGAASAVGPSLPALDQGASLAGPSGVAYTTRLVGSSTEVRQRVRGRVARSLAIAGGFGIQLATLGGSLTGLSPNGRVLVLSDNVGASQYLRARSRFAVVDTRTMSLVQTIELRGDFSVDALSPGGDVLYLIQHVSKSDATKYQVRAYDLPAHRLLPGVIADKSQAGWVMAGFPTARVATQTGAWVYTLYRQDDNYPFVHALDTVHHVAVCVGIPANWTNAAWIASARLELGSGTLRIETRAGKTRFLVDTRTFRVSTP
ncbi:MAG TPA: hypothetical protein VF094_09180 [Gaiellaceae bacterium]